MFRQKKPLMSQGFEKVQMGPETRSAWEPTTPVGTTYRRTPSLRPTALIAQALALNSWTEMAPDARVRTKNPGSSRTAAIFEDGGKRSKLASWTILAAR